MLKKFRFFIIIVLLILVFLPGFAKLQELKERLKEANDKISQTQSQNAILEEKISQMRKNPDYLEMVAREKMGVVKKGETIVKIVHEGEETNLTTNSTAVPSVKD